MYDDDYMGPDKQYNDVQDVKVLSAFYHYSEPFSAECRAFGRLQEAGHEDLAVRCFGYILLDEQHERAMRDQYSDIRLEFDGNGDAPGYEEVRSVFPGKDGRPPPLQGILKAFGKTDEQLGTKDTRRLLGDVIGLQQLGIISIDVGHRQLVGGKFADFSQAITFPHFMTNPELNPFIEPEWISAMGFETFQFCADDYWTFDSMVEIWNDEHDDPKDKLSVFAFPRRKGDRIKYDLRPKPSRERIYSLVDPR